MTRFKKCSTCKNIMNDEYCLSCYHHYHIHKLSIKELKKLRDYYMKEDSEKDENKNNDKQLNN